jgi:hypothetical protein
MTAADEDQARQSGPEVVWQGKRGSPTVLVLDPAGIARHDDLPPAWQAVAESRQIVWCRLPAEGSLSQAEDLLADPDALGPRVDVLAGGPAADSALDVVARHPAAVRSLLLVDPAGAGIDPGAAEAADARWEARTESRRQELTDAGVHVEVVAHSRLSARDRVQTPIPLGHPDVVTEVRRALGQLDARTTDPGAGAS